jgi:hypothetical protein
MFRMFPQLEERADMRAGVLSGGEQQTLTICRTLMGDPTLATKYAVAWKVQLGDRRSRATRPT